MIHNTHNTVNSILYVILFREMIYLYGIMESVCEHIVPLYLNEKDRTRYLITKSMARATPTCDDIYSVFNKYPNVSCLMEMMKFRSVAHANRFIDIFRYRYNVKDIVQYGVLVNSKDYIYHILHTYLETFDSVYSGWGSEPITKKIKNNPQNLKHVSDFIAQNRTK